jgi:D-lactate dehydrogenase
VKKRICFFSSKAYDEEVFGRHPAARDFELKFFAAHLSPESAKLSSGFDALCAFVSDKLSRETLAEIQKHSGPKLLLLRSAGFNHVDLPAAKELGFRVARVPAYSPHAVAEHTVALLMTLNRKIHRAYNRVRESNFSLEGLMGFDVYGKTVGIVGTGKIGLCFARILKGMGANLCAYDPYPNPEARELGISYTSLEEVLRQSDILSLHCPLTKENQHMINAESLKLTKKGLFLINTGRGALIDTKALIASLKCGHLGAVALDVYEEEEALFFEDHSANLLQDDVFARLLSFPNVLITGHQAFFTREALEAIAHKTFANAQAILLEAKSSIDSEL